MHPKLRKIYKELRACGFKFIEAHKLAKQMHRCNYHEVHCYIKDHYPRIKSDMSYNDNFEEWVFTSEYQLPNGIYSYDTMYGGEFVPNK